ncbi:MAG TPA: valine--tRNA ligase [Candidatus Omnitrophica bacterium]|nr:MAG: valine--tRNA ligase [Omnitrophica WOR_2 bacterium GWA2_45_18]HBR15544.1 valine--tRNA ligase [Candidatus Omnitrophota bacterium]
MIELPKRFEFKEVDDKWSRVWEEKNLFHAQLNPAKPPYTVVIPPPNVTGILHMGHALNNTLQDIMIRYKRMKGFETCWMPGTDHAGIATQNVVEKQIAKEGKKRQDLGREEFLKRLWAWKKEYGDTIIHQLKKLGSSCDWPRTRFTMDESYSDAVKHVFVSLYKKGFIYRGEYIINWCPRCLTALSDEEAEHRDIQGNLYHIRYPFKDNEKEGVVVATTRPETMLGDTAVAVNPDDERYRSLIGKTLVLPLINREIKIIADAFVDPQFGTGAVKVTPAHDPNDFEMGRRHNLKFINIMHPNAVLNKEAGDFEGSDRFEAREAIIESLREAKYLVKIEPHTHSVGHCYRCHTVIEPYLSKQWFVKMKPLAKPALEAVQDGRIKFYPERWTKVYLNWMDNIRDWCISRQIWWGHRIPVWYCIGEGASQHPCQEPIVSESAPDKCPRCGSTRLQQDEDVLDTWFSSWLWPFATFDWPQVRPGVDDQGPKTNDQRPKTQDQEVKGGKVSDLSYFYPTASLFTAPEIIFFWVARMIMAGFEFMGDIPFKDVYIHGTVRDAQGRKMSKSLGNAIDPLEIINEYGADALRYSLIVNSGQDLFISKEKFEIGRNFANKIWNAARLILMNTTKIEPDFDLAARMQSDGGLDLPSRWIISRFYTTLEKVSQAIEKFRFSEAETLIHEFFWGNFCDWYLEMIKDKWGDTTIQNTAFKILELSLKMIHPFMPFVTEEIFSYLHKEKGALAIQPWPVFTKACVDPKSEESMAVLLELISAIRNARTQWNVKPNDKIQCLFAAKSEKSIDLLRHNAAILKNLSRIGEISITTEFTVPKNAATGLTGNITYAIPLGDLIDVEQEKKRILTQIEEQRKAAESLSKRLQNPQFVEKAPGDVVQKERERLAGLEQKNNELQQAIAHLE